MELLINTFIFEEVIILCSMCISMTWLLNDYAYFCNSCQFLFSQYCKCTDYLHIHEAMLGDAGDTRKIFVSNLFSRPSTSLTRRASW